MLKSLTTLTFAAGLAAAAGTAQAAGELHIYNWGNYTNPELIEKFEKAHDVAVTLDSYDSNETMLAKVQPGGTGYDIVSKANREIENVRREQRERRRTLGVIRDRRHRSNGGAADQIHTGIRSCDNGEELLDI